MNKLCKTCGGELELVGGEVSGAGGSVPIGEGNRVLPASAAAGLGEVF